MQQRNASPRASSARGCPNARDNVETLLRQQKWANFVAVAVQQCETTQDANEEKEISVIVPSVAGIRTLEQSLYLRASVVTIMLYSVCGGAYPVMFRPFDAFGRMNISVNAIYGACLKLLGLFRTKKEMRNARPGLKRFLEIELRHSASTVLACTQYDLVAYDVNAEKSYINAYGA